ncbi:MAG: glycosyl transferase family 1, partial [Chloroflexi bacterium]|nr:glycosyl transferase family 1 [Chloroflexota bacterium]
MRVLITTSADTEMWHYTSTLADDLATTHGVETLLVSLGGKPSADQLSMVRVGLRTGGGSIELEHQDFPLEQDVAPVEQYATARQVLLDLALRWRTHVLHANEYHLGEVGNNGMPVLVVAHNDLCSRRVALEGETPPLVDSSYLSLVKKGLAAASSVVAPTTFMADSLSRWLDYHGVVRIIPNGIAEHRGGMASVRTIGVVMAGRLWDPAANLECYQVAASKLSDRSFVAVGPTAPPGKTGKPLADNPIRFTGVIPDVELRQLLGSARLFVSPAFYDPNGLAVTEAAYSGCCLVLSDIPAYRALWEDAAVYFDPRDPSALCDRIGDLLENIAQRHTLAGLARDRAQAL